MKKATRAVALSILFTCACSSASTTPEDWAKVKTPAPGDPNTIGNYTNGCVQGAEKLPDSGPGFARYTLRSNRGFGHPNLVGWLKRYSLQLSENNLAVIIEDLSQPRGGPMPGTHESHQTGLDVDIWYYAPTANELATKTPAQVLKLTQKSMLGQDGRVDPKRMTQQEVAKIKAAAQTPGVERIFVHSAIKVYLCKTEKSEKPEDRAWLRVIRPWKNHIRHFHARMACPPDSPDCEVQDANPEGDGCEEAMDRLTKGFPTDWFDKSAKPELPSSCIDVLHAPDPS